MLTLLLYYSGVAWLYCNWALRRQAVVLMYHRVLPTAEAANSFSADAIVVTPETFDRQMAFLRRHFNPVDIDQFLQMLSGAKPWQPRTCLVTFDDGWADNAEHAVPILARRRVPATIFLATGYVGTDACFWQERLSRLLYRAWQGGGAQSLFASLNAAHLLSYPPAQVRLAIRHLVTSLKKRDRAEIDRLMEQAAALPGPPASVGADRFMSWPEAAKTATSGFVTLGSHAHSHTPLTRLSRDDVRKEIEHAAAQLQAQLGPTAMTFAYPNGDYSDQVAAQVRDFGYRTAFTTDTGRVRAGDDPMKLRRMNISERGTESRDGFLCRLLGWL